MALLPENESKNVARGVISLEVSFALILKFMYLIEKVLSKGNYLILPLL